MISLKNKHQYLFILLTNCMVIYGVFIHKWPIFIIIYAFWLETLVISFFDALKILFAKGEKQPAPHLIKALIFFIFRLGLLLFYLLFIVVFIGVLHAEADDLIKITTAVTFKDSIFNSVMLSMFLSNILNFIITYWTSGERSNNGPSYFYKFLDVRLFVIHIVIVLGTFAMMFAEKNFPQSKKEASTIALLVVFIIIKTIADIIYSAFSKKQDQIEPFEKFI